jgi:large subunit ribosomal protein L21
MYAVVRTGGKQYRVAPGDVIRVEKLPGDVGGQVDLDQVLLLADGDKLEIGRPVVAGARVRGEIVEQGRAPKILIFKYKRRKRYRRKAGHRQPYTAIKVTEIAGEPAAAGA